MSVIKPNKLFLRHCYLDSGIYYFAIMWYHGIVLYVYTYQKLNLVVCGVNNCFKHLL